MINTINKLSAKLINLEISPTLEPSLRADLLTIQDRALYELEVDPTNNSIRLAKSVIKVSSSITKLEKELKMLRSMLG